MTRWKKLLFVIVGFLAIITIIISLITLDYLSGKKSIDEIVNLNAVSYKLEIDDPLGAFEDIYNSPIWDSYYDHPQLVNIKSSIDYLDQEVEQHQNLSFLFPFDAHRH